MKFNAPSVPNPAYAADVDAMQTALNKQGSQLRIAPTAAPPAQPSVNPHPVTATKFHHTRILLR